MWNSFVSKKIVESTSASVDSTMLKANGHVWHKSDIKKDRQPIAGIDTDVRCGYYNSKDLIFACKLHMSCSTVKLIVPLTADTSTANVHGSQKFDDLVEPLAGILENILADPTYNDFKLYDSSDQYDLRLAYPIKIYRSTPPERIKLVEFYKSPKGQELYADKKISI